MEGGGAEGARRGRSSVVVDGGLKKGPWSAVEDEILMEYVKRHGEGNWNAVQRNSGLMRCGKSCRLRWANHLRPNLKKGSFSPDEEKLIIQLHAKLGNKWARMASQLPGRTDNEIKNYWNTRLKRRQRAGLPLYPQELRQEASDTPPPPPEPCRHYGFHGGQRQSTLSHDPPPEVSLASFLNLPPRLHRPPAPSSFSDPFAAGGSSSAAGTSFLLFGQHLPTPDLHPPATYHSGGLDYNTHPMILTSMNMNFPATQTPPQLPQIIPTRSSSPSAFSGPTGGEMMEVSDNVIADNNFNSGLLGDVLRESVALKQKSRAQERSSASAAEAPVTGKGKKMACEWDGLSPSQSSAGLIKTNEHGGLVVEEEDMKNYMDDELLSLLNSFPAAAPLPDWYPKSSDHELSLNNDGTRNDQQCSQEMTNFRDKCNFSDDSREVLRFL